MPDRPGKLSCGAVLVRKADEGWQTLMLRAYRNWDFPKGLREDGETPLEAAQREVGEETGISDLNFDWGERFKDTGPYSPLFPGQNRAGRG
jgi:8-oxo-dGTP pyrophosphatase MutT (NUDIX family)